MESRDFIGIDRNPDYVEITEARTKHAEGRAAR